ncbi:MAG: hypothetical protein ACKESB_02645 [Candidatus Hodgkinia cicadicola]
MIASEVAKLVKARRVTFGKKASAVWSSIGNKTNVPIVSTVISRRWQLRWCKIAIVLHTLASMIGGRYEVFGSSS